MTVTGTPRKLIFYQGNTQTITFVGMTDDLTGNYVNDASVTATLVDQNGNPVPGCDGVTLTASGAGGNYQGVFGDNTFEPEVGDGYRLVVDAAEGGTSYGHWEFTAEVKARTR